MTIEETTNADSASRLSAGLERFEAWWNAHGQYCRAGGGEYEKTFAFRAWEAAEEEHESNALDPMNETYLAGYRSGVLAEREACAIKAARMVNGKSIAAAIRARSNAEPSRPREGA